MVICGLCICAVPGNPLKQTLHLCQRHSFILCSQLANHDLEDILKFHPQKIHSSILLTSEFSVRYLFVLHINSEKQIKTCHKIISVSTILQDVFHIFPHLHTANTLTLVSSSAMSISKKASFGLASWWPAKMGWTVLLPLNRWPLILTYSPVLVFGTLTCFQKKIHKYIIYIYIHT